MEQEPVEGIQFKIMADGSTLLLIQPFIENGKPMQRILEIKGICKFCGASEFIHEKYKPKGWARRTYGTPYFPRRFFVCGACAKSVVKWASSKI